MQTIRQLSTLGLVVGALFFSFSLTPSLLPRPFYMQGLISGLSFAVGYAIGWAGHWLWLYLEVPVPRPRTERGLKAVAAVVCLSVMAVFLWRASEWQNSVRTVMGLEGAEGIRPLGVAVIALLVAGLLFYLTRLFRKTFRYFSRKLHLLVPRRVSRMVALVVAVALFWSVMEGIIFRLALRGADHAFARLDAMIPSEMDRPDDPAKTGSVESLIAWGDLGYFGREFISSGPTAEQLRTFHGEETPEPIRVYVGLNAADTPEARARLALEELKRVKAFERSVLLLVTPTGRGWVDAAGQDPVEYLHRGDIATVAVQYSYLPSPLSLLVEGAYGVETARAVFREIYGHWTGLPKEDRPRLYLQGLSLGALNSDLSFDAHDILSDPFDGSLWVGPPFRSYTWNRVTANRQQDSPAWLPRFRDGSVVRFMNQEGCIETSDTEWGAFRIAYLQYASDPIVFFSVRSFYRKPDWMHEPRGPDVSAELRWYPVVTMLQLAADMALGGAPPGFGHSIAAEHYIDAWIALMEPGDWSEEDTRRLRYLYAEEQTDDGTEMSCWSAGSTSICNRGPIMYLNCSYDHNR